MLPRDVHVELLSVTSAPGCAVVTASSRLPHDSRLVGTPLPARTVADQPSFSIDKDTIFRPGTACLGLSSTRDNIPPAPSVTATNPLLRVQLVMGGVTVVASPTAHTRKIIALIMLGGRDAQYCRQVNTILDEMWVVKTYLIAPARSVICRGTLSNC